jgi:hypothetical protein
MRFLLRKSSPRLTATKDIVETRDGAVARLISVNDTPLDQAAEQNEQARLDTLMSDPSLQRHRKQGEDADMGIVLKLLRMLPNAFESIWECGEIHLHAQSPVQPARL